MAHALYGYDGPCRNIHGHTYTLNVTLIGKIFSQADHPKDGMVIDFSEFKKSVTEHVISKFDHSLVLNAHSPHADLPDLQRSFERLNYVPYQPSCENLLVDFQERIAVLLPAGIFIHHLKLQETASSFAEWYQEDNNLN